MALAEDEDSFIDHNIILRVSETSLEFHMYVFS